MLSLTSCFGVRDDNISKPSELPKTDVIDVKPETTPLGSEIADLNQKIKESEDKIKQAKEKNDELARLKAEKEWLEYKMSLAIAQVKQLKANIDTYKTQVSDKEKEIKEARILAWQEKLWWAAGIIGFLAIVATAVCIGFPLIRPVAKYAAAILSGLSVTMLVVAYMLPTIAWLLSLVPYILIGSLVVGAGYAVYLLRHWWKDHTGLIQTINGIEEIKPSIKGFGDHMTRHVDTVLENQIRNYKQKIKENKARKDLSNTLKSVRDKVRTKIKNI
jgi:predicted phage tail protein